MPNFGYKEMGSATKIKNRLSLIKLKWFFIFVKSKVNPNFYFIW